MGPIYAEGLCSPVDLLFELHPVIYVCFDALQQRWQGREATKRLRRRQIHVKRVQATAVAHLTRI